MSLEADIALRLGSFSLEIRFTAPGDGITVLFGPSGAGKSTLLSVLAGLKRPDRGSIKLGQAAVDDLAPHRRGIGLVFQDSRLFPHLNVRQNIEYAWRRTAREKRLGIEDAAGFFDILPILDRPVGSLSGGEKSRVALARALVSRPDFLLLDEPFAALDGTRRRAFIQALLRMHHTYQLPMLVVTHNIDDAAALASHIVGLAGGRVVAAGPFGKVTRLPAFRELLDVRDVGAALPTSGLRGVRAPLGGQFWLRADAVLLASRCPEGLSARNVFEGRVVTLQAGSQDVIVEVDTVPGTLLARITAEAGEELALAPGKQVWAIVKAHQL